MNDIATVIDACVEQFRRGDEEAAFFGLLELETATLAHMIDRFERERDNNVRAFLVEVIWQRRDPAAIPFLGRAIRDADQRVWRTALDGLVTLASPSALQSLSEARTAAGDEERTAWLDEAVGQVAAALASTLRTTF